ncbi:MAG: 30S ribosomal protein S12 methylthiotransferase RimO [Parachlamydiales bacterium]|nr:30S ribosomal protein S12 methylthiotransferase RimO [Parachlamydiales bacterium]
MSKLYFISLGCTRNLIDSEVMIGYLQKNGYSITLDLKKSDVIVVNTCGFLQEAREEAYQILDEVFKNKKNRSKVIITGCMANLFKDDLVKRYPEIFSIITAGHLENILDTIKVKQINTSILSHLQKKDLTRTITTPKHLAYLKIAEGCSKRCAYCIIPKIKGPLKSRSISSILKEFKLLIKNGVYEVNLIAQDLLDFQKDQNIKRGLITLVKEILKIKKDFWLRLLYVYPDDITDEFIDLLASDIRICKYLDIPIQHISDNILKKMNRKTSKKRIFEIFEKIKSKMPDFSFRTSIMVGFPGETEKDFNELIDFIKKFQIDNLAVFKYSNEKHALSYNMKDQVDEKVKQQRFDILTKLQFELTQKRNKKLIGKSFDVLIDGYHKDSNLLAVARNYSQAYDIDSSIIINDIAKIKSFGKIQKVKIIDSSGYDLIASI